MTIRIYPVFARSRGLLTWAKTVMARQKTGRKQSKTPKLAWLRLPGRFAGPRHGVVDGHFPQARRMSLARSCARPLPPIDSALMAKGVAPASGVPGTGPSPASNRPQAASRVRSRASRPLLVGAGFGQQRRTTPTATLLGSPGGAGNRPAGLGVLCHGNGLLGGSGKEIRIYLFP